MLKDAGYRIIEAENGKDALQKFRTEKIDMVIMDLKMPVMDGYEASKRIRNLRKSVPIIGVSAYAMQDDMDKAINSGFNFFITKPFNKNQLLQKVQEYLKTAK